MLRPSAVLSESKHGLQPMTMSSVSFYKVERNFWGFFYDQNFFFVFFFHVVLHIEKNKLFVSKGFDWNVATSLLNLFSAVSFL